MIIKSVSVNILMLHLYSIFSFFLFVLKELFIQTTVQYLRKKAPQLLLGPSSKDELSFKPISNIETINILLSILQMAIPSITNPAQTQEIQTMISTAKILNNTGQTRPEPFPNPLPHQFTPSPSQLRPLQSKNFISR